MVAALRMVAGLFFVALTATACGGSWDDWWLTPEQQAQRLADSGEHALAAERFTDSMRAGSEWYRAGEFERAAAEFGRSQSAEALFNRGNALVFQGKYEDAIQSYERALAVRPNWIAAEQNLGIATARLALLAPPDDDFGGTGGQLEADEVVFDLSSEASKNGGTEVVEDEGGFDDDQLRELWLRRVESTPADFLAARFAYQLAKQAESAAVLGGQEQEDNE